MQGCRLYCFAAVLITCVGLCRTASPQGFIQIEPLQLCQQGFDYFSAEDAYCDRLISEALRDKDIHGPIDLSWTCHRRNLDNPKELLGCVRGSLALSGTIFVDEQEVLWLAGTGMEEPAYEEQRMGSNEAQLPTGSYDCCYVLRPQPLNILVNPADTTSAPREP